MTHCENKDCNAIMESGASECPACGKRTYFYLKHPQALLIMSAILILGPIFWLLNLLWTVIISPLTLSLALFDAIKYKFTKNELDDDIIKE